MRPLGKEDCVGSGSPLQSSREIRCLAEHSGLLRSTLTDDVADDYGPGGNTYAHLQGHVSIQVGNGIDDGKAGPRCPFRIILPRGGGVEQRQESAVATEHRRRRQPQGEKTDHAQQHRARAAQAPGRSSGGVLESQVSPALGSCES